MKKMIVWAFAMTLLLVCCVTVLAEEESWNCPSCGATVTGNFCSQCGAKKPEDGKWKCSACGTENEGNFCSNCGAKRNSEANENANEDKIRLDLNIAFEKNSYFSTYDVKLLIDDEWITTMRHGVDYAGTVYVTPGKHIIRFVEDGSYPSEGSTIIKIENSSVYRCEIHAKSDAIQITGEKVEKISDDKPAPDEKSVVRVDGDIQLSVYIEFRKNAMFSTYDVDVYCDDMFIATLPHGKDYENTWLVSEGNHLITFYRSGKKSIRGTSSIKVEKDAYFTCKIKAESNKVEVTNEKLTK